MNIPLQRRRLGMARLVVPRSALDRHLSTINKTIK
jgi:hypothetical protein